MNSLEKITKTVTSPQGNSYVIELKNEKVVSLEKGKSTIEYTLKQGKELFEGTHVIEDFDSLKYVNCIMQIANDHEKRQKTVGQREKIKKEALEKLEEWDGRYFTFN